MISRPAAGPNAGTPPWWRLPALLALVGWASVASAAVPPIPPLAGPVMDEAHLLPIGDAARLRQRLLALREQTGVQLVFASIAELGDEEIAERALRMAEAWQIGRRGQDDGVLLLVAPAARRVRIEVGYGLEGVLPDARAHQLIDATLNEHPEGMSAPAVLALCERVAATVEQALPRRRGASSSLPAALVDPVMASALLGVAAALFVAWLSVGRRMLNRRPFRPLRPPADRPGRAVGQAGSFKNSLWYDILWGWLLSRGSRRRGGSSDDGPDRFGGGGGRFGGGGASGRW